MILFSKLIIALVGVLLTTLSMLVIRRTSSMNSGRFLALALVVGFLSRIILFLIVFIFLGHEATSDVTVYFSEAKQVLDGKMPMVDIATAYGPLFNYCAAAIIAIFGDSRALILSAIFIEMVAVLLWVKVGRKAFPEYQVRRSTMFYLFNPVAICTSALAGQNHIWLSAFLAGSLFALFHGRIVWSGLLLGSSIIVVKFLTLLFAPICFLFLSARRRAIWLCAFLALPITVYAFFVVQGAALEAQVLFHALYPASGNLPYVLSVFGLDLTIVRVRLVVDAVGFVVLCGTFVLAIWKSGLPDRARAVQLCGYVMLVTLVVQPKSFTSYLVIALFPMCLVIVEQCASISWIAIWQLFFSLAALEPSLWFRWMSQGDLRGLLYNSKSEFSPTDWVFFVGEVVLLAGYCSLLFLHWRALVCRQNYSSHPRT